MTSHKQIQANRANASASTGPKTVAGKAAVAGNATRLGIYASCPVVPLYEQADDWEAYRKGLLDDLAPVGALEEVLAERVASCFWRMRRVTRWEVSTVATRFQDLSAHVAGWPAHITAQIAEKQALERQAAAAVQKAKEELAKWERKNSRHRRPADGECIRQRLKEAETQEMELQERWLSLLGRLMEWQAMPDAETLGKVARYEAHLQRQATQALHELQRLQAARAGADVPPPTAGDMTIHGADGSDDGPHANGVFSKQSRFADIGGGGDPSAN